MTKTEYSTYLIDKAGALPFCPGCGHHTLVRALDKALIKLQLRPEEVVIVTDIGCIGLSDRHFNTNAFHGLHGRAITYACGLKLARPELTVIALKGDGGCGIGGTHLLNVARRNIGITLIVANNFNYGMTGGQHSVSTPEGCMTSTTPRGNVERGMDLCGVAMAAGAAWVYRSTVFEKDLSDIFAQAIQLPGFAFLDVWELCTAYFSPRNTFKRTELYGLLDSQGFKLGLLANNPRPDYGQAYRRQYAAASVVKEKHPTIDTCFSHTIERQTGIVIAGSAGQKIKSTATVFAQASMLCGLDATQKDDYPITVMTGHSLAEIILSPNSIEYTGIEHPDYLLILSPEGLSAAMQKLKKMGSSSTVLAENNLNLPEMAARVIRLDVNTAGKETGRLSAAVIMLSTLLYTAKLFPAEAFSAAISRFQKSRISEANLNAVRAGIELAQEAINGFTIASS